MTPAAWLRRWSRFWRMVVSRWWFAEGNAVRFRKSFRGMLGAVLITAVAALPCLASEVAVLKNGFNITHVRRATMGKITRLYVSTDATNYVDVPTEQIDHYEEGLDLPASNVAPFAQNAKDGAPSAGTATGFPLRPKTDLNEVVNEASDRYRLDPDLVNSVINAESGFNVKAVSPKGARGLMQLMPGTAAELGVPNAFDPQANIDGGARYLRELLERYNFDLVKALAAYNAGPQRVEQFGGVPPYYETRAYVARIVRDFNKKKTAQQKPTPSTASNKTSSGSPTKTSAAASTQKVASNKAAPRPRSSSDASQSSKPRVQASASKPAE
jgi:soluble lytic murein transglycosylase-like protein